MMNLLFCFDQNYQQHFGVAITSVLLNNLSSHFDVHIITNFMEEKLKQKLDTLSKNYKCSFHLYIINNLDKISKLKVSDHVSNATYYRLIMAEILPKHIDKVLYLDSDVVVISPLEELYNIDLENYFIAASGFSGTLVKSKGFNSGVMVVNLEKWRNEQISTKVIDFATKNRDKLPYHDQSALNRVIKQNYLIIDRKWNFQVDLSPRKIQKPDDNIALKNARIIHYIGSSKPWYFWISDQRKNIYELYLKKSLWSTSKLQMIFQQTVYFRKALQRKLKK
ncbi:glycosyl transferase, family 8 [Trichodesmium erythraeum IMS101]|uniref:Glycosyl transferase, family 8 n=1 Tax=Trichodesmium erythraeum (strain IMS101) TaxID=203124 RepID=Q116W1_TRIEI|nr:glycosyltransferase family 8 protein [Trichodesmium erythraeum GBRTRLIN201]